MVTRERKKAKAYQILVGSNFLASTALQKKFLTFEKNHYLSSNSMPISKQQAKNIQNFPL
jgi:hypothetical protein